MQDSTFIGLDVHKATISIGVTQAERRGEVRHWGKIPHRADHVRKLVEKLAADGRRLHFCYEAGPCGYGLYRQLVELGHDCIVVAPSLIPVKAGGNTAESSQFQRIAEVTTKQKIMLQVNAPGCLKPTSRNNVHGGLRLTQERFMPKLKPEKSSDDVPPRNASLVVSALAVKKCYHQTGEYFASLQ